MPILQVKINGAWVEIPALVGKTGPKGDKGDKGNDGQGFSDEQITLLESVLNLVTFSDATAGQTAVNNLLASLRGTTPDIPTIKYTNLVPKSIDATGAIFNGVGYKNDVRINSSGAESTSGAYNTTATGFIKVSGGDIVRVKGGEFLNTMGNNANSIAVYNSSFGHLGTTTVGNSYYGIFANTYSDYRFSSVVEEKTGVYKWVVPPTASGVEYVRLSCWGNSVQPGANLIVTINEEITD